MIHIILSGALGQMGRAIAALVGERNDCRIAAGIDARGGEAGFPVFLSPEACDVHGDVLVDFSHPSALEGLLGYAVGSGTPAVICTTGLSAAQVDEIHRAAEKIPVFFSANMSLGVNLMAALCEKAAMALGGEWDIEILEKHHSRKLDAPSGTALMIAERMAGALREKPQYIYDRHSERRPRRRGEIGIHSVRGGTIVGEHEVLFAGTDEVLTISHTASSKRVFAAGAVNAALFLTGEGPGLYDMGDLV